MTYQRWYGVYLVTIITSIISLLVLAHGLGPQIDKGQAIQEQINQISTQYATLQVWMTRHDEQAVAQAQEQASWMAHIQESLDQWINDQRTAMTPDQRTRLLLEHRLRKIEKKLPPSTP